MSGTPMEGKQRTFRKIAWDEYKRLRFGKEMRLSDKMELVAEAMSASTIFSAVLIAIGFPPSAVGFLAVSSLSALLFATTYVVRAVAFRRANPNLFDPNQRG